MTSVKSRTSLPSRIGPGSTTMRAGRNGTTNNDSVTAESMIDRSWSVLASTIGGSALTLSNVRHGRQRLVIAVVGLENQRVVRVAAIVKIDFDVRHLWTVLNGIDLVYDEPLA